MGFAIINISDDAGHQAIRIPDDMKIQDDKLYVKRVGNALYLIPFNNPWQNLFESLDKFTPDFMEERNQPKEQDRETFE